MLPLISTLLVLAAAPPETLLVPMKEIVVTGTRTPESALRVPAAISIVDKRRFQDTRSLSLKDALGNIPGVFVQSRAGAPDVRVTIRGFGARGSGERSNVGSMRGIRVLTDGIPVTEPDGRTALDLVDIGGADRIEVTRSNASALYGNASGGVVHLRSFLDFTSPWVEVRERAGSFGFHREEGVVGFTMGEARGTVSVLNSTFDGWRAHSQSSVTQATARLMAPLDAKTRLSVMLNAVSDLNRFPGPLRQDQLDSLPEQANANFVSRDDRRRNRQGRLAATLDRALTSAQDLTVSLFVEPKVLQRSERGRFRDFNRYHVGGNALYSVRVTTAGGLQSRTSIGADEAFQDGSILFYDLNPDGSRSTTVRANKREGASSAGGFVEEQLDFNERWSARAAVRYDNLWYIADDYTDPTLDATKRFTRFTPKGSLSWHSEEHTIYAALGGGVEAPAFNEIDPPVPYDTITAFNPFLEAMRSTSYELGAKGTLLSHGIPGRMGYDFAVYQIDVKNDIVPWGGGAYFYTAGKSRRRGVELGLDWAPIERTLISVATTLSDNKYLEYRNDLGTYDGNKIAGLPRTVVSGSVRHTLVSGISGEVSAEHVGKYFANDANSAEAPAYTLLGATLGVSRAMGNGSVRFFVAGNNLTDEHHVASVFINGTADEYFEPGLPRSWTAGATVRWK